MKRSVAVSPISISSSQTKVRELSPKAHLRGLELNQVNANAALKVLYIEQLGLPCWIRTVDLFDFATNRRCAFILQSVRELAVVKPG